MGFIERLEHDDTLSSTMDDDEYSDADMSNLEDASHLDDSIDDSDDPIPANVCLFRPVSNCANSAHNANIAWRKFSSSSIYKKKKIWHCEI